MIRKKSYRPNLFIVMLFISSLLSTTVSYAAECPCAPGWNELILNLSSQSPQPECSSSISDNLALKQGVIISGHAYKNQGAVVVWFGADSTYPKEYKGVCSWDAADGKNYFRLLDSRDNFMACATTISAIKCTQKSEAEMLDKH